MSENTTNEFDISSALISDKDFEYDKAVEGTWGIFETPAGRVSYILTKARLGIEGADNESRLTSQLNPVREILPTNEMDFNQLLQRDLDDHRVATELVPYILNKQQTGPAFLPPILAVLLPFKGKTPLDKFPESSPETLKKINNLPFITQSFQDTFQVQKLARSADKLHELSIGRLCWNNEKSKLVVLDGQHRAMALIAIDRTVRNTWDQSAGSRYQHFYKNRIEEILNDKNDAIELSLIEYPVLVCWFDDPKIENVHKVARKLFVDVNKEARKPSEARLILLSDTKLVNIFARSILNKIRINEKKSYLPISAIEFDNPHSDKKITKPARWTALATLHTLKYCAQAAVFGPPEFVKNVDKITPGRLPWKDMNPFMRKQLSLADHFPSTITDDDRELKVEDVGNDNFPTSKSNIKKLENIFFDAWGSVILHVLSNLQPYKAHCDALLELEANHVRGGLADLAYEALFVGVGQFWTLRESNNHWLEMVNQNLVSKHSKPDIVKAWDLIEEKKGQFIVLRSLKYSGKTDKDSQAKVDNLFELVNTHACQVGAVITISSLAFRLNIKNSDLSEFSNMIVSAWNKFLSKSIHKVGECKFIFCRDGINYPINRLGKLDTPYASYFRYFWLEILRAGLDDKEWVTGERIVLDELIKDSRSLYLNYLVNEHKKHLKSTNPSWGQDKIAKKALENESNHIETALVKWFGYNKNEVTLAEVKIVEQMENSEQQILSEDDDFIDNGNTSIDSLSDFLKNDDSEDYPNI